MNEALKVSDTTHEDQIIELVNQSLPEQAEVRISYE